MDIIMCIFGAALIVALISLFVYVCIKEPKVIVITLFVAIILAGLVVAPTVAEEAYEERTVFVTDFRLDIGCVEVTDEDGFSWLFELGENSWELGQEFTLKLMDIPELWNDVSQIA